MGKLSGSIDESDQKKNDGKLEASYTTGFDVKIVEAEGIKKVILTGTLLDNSINRNGWRVPEGHDSLAKEFIGIAIKMNHMVSEWEIVGTGTSSELGDGKVFYEATITDPDAVQKFETNTWNVNNLGISPTFAFDHIVCSICSEHLESLVGHEHLANRVYDGTKCFYDIMGPRLTEASLTSTPAYKPSAGTIDTAYLTASLNKALNFDKKVYDINMEETRMTDKTIESFEAKVLEKDGQIKTLTASMTGQDTKITELEKSVKASEEKEVKLKEKFDTLESSNKELKEKLNTYVIASRKVELEKRLQNKELVEELLAKEMTDEDFKTEVDRIEKIQASVKEKNSKGSVPPENASNTEELQNKVGVEMFGPNFKSLAGIEKEGDK